MFDTIVLFESVEASLLSEVCCEVQINPMTDAGQSSDVTVIFAIISPQITAPCALPPEIMFSRASCVVGKSDSRWL